MPQMPECYSRSFRFGLLTGLCNARPGCASSFNGAMTDVLAGTAAATVEQAGKVRTGTPVERLLVCGDTGSRAYGRRGAVPCRPRRPGHLARASDCRRAA
jgi:hypothetical protein